MLNEVKNQVTQGQGAARASGGFETVTVDGHARFQQAVLAGNAFWCATQTAGTSQAGLSATTPVLTLYNPKGNNKAAVLWYAGASFIVAFAAGSAVWIAANINVAAAAVSGTAVSGVTSVAIVTNAQLGNGSFPTCIPLTAATLPAAPVAVRQLASGLTGAITTIPYVGSVGGWQDGSLVLLPGSAISIQTSTASGAGMFCDYGWEEIPLSWLNA